MRVSLSNSVVGAFPNINIGIISVEKMDSGACFDKIEKLLVAEIEKIKSDDKNVEFGLYHSVYKQLGLNLKKYMSSAETLYTRVKTGKDLSSINPVADLCNYISLKYNIPVGACDSDKLSGDLKLEYVDGPDHREMAYVDDRSKCTVNWNWRQSEECRVDNGSENIVIVVDGFEENRDKIDGALSEIQQIIEECCRLNPIVGIINKDAPSMKVSDLTEEEQEIENALKIILKGVCQHTEIGELRNKMIQARRDGRKLRVKFGLDPSAPDIHLGHAVVLRKINQLQKLGFEAVIIIGDFTGRIGDPTGKSRTRNELSEEKVKENAQTYAEQVFKVIDRSRTVLRYNSEWLGKMTFDQVLNLASKFTVARILERDDFKNRYTNQTPIGLHEFFYPLMQAYDSVEIEADIELGGLDQTFNVMLGRTLQKMCGQAQQTVLMMPLLVGTDGKEKMSKSLGNYICIDEAPDVMYEKVLKIPDELIMDYYNLCTDIHPDDIKKMELRLKNGENPRDIKMELAREIVCLYHGQDSAVKAQEKFISIYQKGVATDDTKVLWLEKNNAGGSGLLEAMMDTGLYKSKSDIRRLFAGNAISINGEKVTEASEITEIADESIIKVGKGRFFKVRISE